jgi:hypothetical protein
VPSGPRPALLPNGPALPLCREPDPKLSAQMATDAAMWASSSLCAESQIQSSRHRWLRALTSGPRPTSVPRAVDLALGTERGRGPHGSACTICAESFRSGSRHRGKARPLHSAFVSTAQSSPTHTTHTQHLALVGPRPPATPPRLARPRPPAAPPRLAAPRPPSPPPHPRPPCLARRARPSRVG